MMTAKEYIDSLRKLNTRVYMFGEKIDNWVDHPMIRPSINCVAMTYALAQDPQYEELMTATSSLTGRKINRFTHLHQSADDLVKKVKMQRLLGQKTASCFQRCVGMDAFNAVYSSTYEIDEKYGTHYHENFKKFLIYVQDNDLTVDGAMTDPKGDRSKAPHQQKDPDLFVHVVEKRDDGIVIRGAKAHMTGMVNSHWMLIMPTMGMLPGEEDYTICCAVPVDAPGITHIFGRQTNDDRKMEGTIDQGNANYGIVGGECLTVLDDVFVPNEYIFMNGDTKFSGLLVELKTLDEPEKKGIAGLFRKAKINSEELKARFSTAEVNVDRISGELEKHKVTLLKDVAVMDQMYDRNLQYFKELTMYILAGKKKLELIRSTELRDLQNKAQITGKAEDAQAAKDLEDLCTRFEKKLYDLELTRMVSIQTAPQIRMIQNSDSVMAEKIQSTIVNTIPLWKNQMIIALGIHHSTEAAKAQRQVSDMTNELLKKNAENLKMATIETAKESERGIVDMETLKQTNQSLISTLDEVMKIQEDGRQKRAAAEVELVQLENDIKHKMLELSAGGQRS